MASIIILLVVAGCVAYQYLKGNLTRAVATIIVIIFASMVAFGYFEWLAGFFLSKGSDSRFPALVPWAQPLCFMLLFILVFAVLQTGVMQVMKQPVDFGLLPERIGRVVCGIFMGLFLSGLLLTVAGMAPLPHGYPYERFDQRNPRPDQPNKVLLNVDGLVTGWFSMVSKGSFSAISSPQSFAALHPDYLSQMYLNRLGASETVPLVAPADAINAPNKAGYWYAPENLKDMDDQIISPESGHTLMVVRIGVRKRHVRDAGSFTPSQVRVVCKRTATADDALAGQGVNVYPLGYLAGKNIVQVKRLTEAITVTREDIAEGETGRWIDFVFQVPSGHEPVLAEFKLGSVVRLSSLASADQIPAPAYFQGGSGQDEQNDEDNDNASGQQNRQGAQSNQNSSTRENDGSGLSTVGKTLTGGALEEDMQLQ